MGQDSQSGARPRRALGRGLDALLPSSQPAGLREVEVDRIEPNPEQPRQHFDEAGLAELTASIRDHGVVQPLVVTSVADDRYQLVVGERRLRAARAAGLNRVPVVVKEAGGTALLELALIENLQRADLNPLEEAEAYRRLIEEHGLTQETLGRRLARSRTAITNTLRLLQLSPPVRAALASGRISEGHGRALLGLPDADRQAAALGVVESRALSVRQTEELVRRWLAPPDYRRAPRSADLAALEDELRRALGTKVSLKPGRKGGRLIIEYYSDDDFQGLYERLTRLAQD